MMQERKKGFTLIEVLIVTGLIAAISIASVGIYHGATAKTRDRSKKRAVDAIAQAYESGYDTDAQLYYPLTDGDFLAGSIPKSPDQSFFSGLLTDSASAFQVCAVLGGETPTSCSESSNTCYCVQSIKGTYLSPTPGGGEGGPTTSPDPTSDPSPTPTGGSCTLSTASWNSTTATEGEVVFLTVTSTGSCEGMQVDFEVWENDSITEGIGDDAVATNPGSVLIPAENSVTTSWTAEWQDDCFGLCLPPEYYFNASLAEGGSSIASSDPLLTVDPLVQPSPTPSPSPIPTDTPTPTPAQKRIFITSTTFSGNLGGLGGADASCQTAANNASLGGTWKAWLSDATVSASSRLNHSTIPYSLVSGTTIANNWADLIDGTIASQILTNEFGATVTTTYQVWTNTNSNGSIYGTTYNCNNWSSATSGYYGRFGRGDLTTGSWSNVNHNTCNGIRRLYCFEQ